MDVRLLVCEGGALERGGQPLQEHSVRLLGIRSWLWPGRSLGHGYEGCVSLGERQTVPSGRMDGPLRSDGRSPPVGTKQRNGQLS